MPAQMEQARPARRFWSPEIMRDELVRSLAEALYELEVLPRDEDGALIGLHAVMDDLETAIRRIRSLDLPRSA